jgi:hypothetical protein
MRDPNEKLEPRGYDTANNMGLWNSVCETDPSHTKKVNQRGGFTAIDAMYQVQEATRLFGPAGIGWGWDFTLEYPPNDTILAIVTLWHGNRDQTIKQVGQKGLGGQRVDEDAAKKAVTDGLTKCLSYLGFNADVFLGKFDDNKYVQALEAKTKERNRPSAVVAFEAALVGVVDKATLTRIQAEHKDALVTVGLENLEVAAAIRKWQGLVKNAPAEIGDPDD